MSVIDINSSDAANDLVLDDIVQPFQLESSSLRGRLVRLGPALDGIIKAHNYPEVVSHLIAEMISTALLLTSMLKYDGIFTLQTSSDGPISMMVADVETSGAVRAYAYFDEQKLDEIKSKSIKDLIGKGYLAFTVDQKGQTDKYQGIVEIKGDRLVESIQNYFDQSEQIGTAFKMAITQHGGNWRAGGIMLQNMPDHGEYAQNRAEIKALKKQQNKDEEIDDPINEHWNRASILLETCTDEEFTNPGISPNDLLRRLFHEEGVRVYTPIHIRKACRCSEEKIQSVLKTLSEEDLRESAKDGKISITCEFCAKEYTSDLDELLGSMT